MLHKKKMNMLNSDLANQMLQNIFEACDVEPNTVSLEELESYSNYRKDRFAVRKGILLIIMILFLLVPLLFVPPAISTLEQIDTESTAYRLTIESLFPVSSVTATINGKSVPVSEETDFEYTLRPEQTGEMTVVVTCINRQYAKKTIKILSLDKEAPKYISSSAANGTIIITVKDSGSGVDWNNITGRATDGSPVKPTSCDPDRNQVVFSRSDAPINILIPDKAGNQLKLVLTI